MSHVDWIYKTTSGADADAGTPSLHEAARAMGVEFVGEPTPREAFVEANGLRFHYLDWGSPANLAVILLHGFAQTCHSWDFAALGLCDRFRVVAVDQRGHGDTEWASDADYSLRTQRRDLHAVLKALELVDVVLMGNSMGGRTSLLYAAAHPETVRALVMVDAAPEHLTAGATKVRRFVEQPDVLDSFEDFVAMVHRYNDRRPIEHIRDSLVHNVKQLPDGRWTWKYDGALRSREHAFWQQPGLVERLWAAVGKVRCPTLLVRGAESDVVSSATLEEMRRRIPTCDLATVERAGHLVAGDNPAGLRKAVTPFLDSLR